MFLLSLLNGGERVIGHPLRWSANYSCEVPRILSSEVCDWLVCSLQLPFYQVQ